MVQPPVHSLTVQPSPVGVGSGGHSPPVVPELVVPVSVLAESAPVVVLVVEVAPVVLVVVLVLVVPVLAVLALTAVVDVGLVVAPLVVDMPPVGEVVPAVPIEDSVVPAVVPAEVDPVLSPLEPPLQPRASRIVAVASWM